MRPDERPADPDGEYHRLPDLPVDADESTLLDYADDLCAEPCEREIVHLVFLDSDGVQVGTAGRLHNVPRLPRRSDLEQFVDMLRHQGLRVRARQVALVWQTLDDDLADQVGVDAWSTGLRDRLAAGPLRIRALWHRAPTGVTTLWNGAARAGGHRGD